jgi:tetratricopeptide (TPR) repeat protein
MKIFHNRAYLRSVDKIILIISMTLILSLPLTKAAQWNYWTLQFMWHTLKPTNAPLLSASFPETSLQARVWLAQDALAEGNVRKAMLYIEPLGSTNDQRVLMIQASVLEQAGNFSEAIKILVHLKSYPLLIKLGDHCTRINNQSDALTAYQSAFSINPEDGSLPLAYFLANFGKNIPEAEAVLKNELATDKSSVLRPTWYAYLGEYLRKQKKFDEAEMVYHSALVENPKNWATYIALGWDYYERGDGMQAAIDEFNKAIALNTRTGSGYLAVGQVLTQEGRFNEADHWYQLALEHEPKNNPWVNMWMIVRANNILASGDISKALSLYQEIEKVYPDFPAVYYEIANAYWQENQREDAEQSIKKALQFMNPANDYYYLRAGQIFEWNGETDQAMDAYQRALITNPSNMYAQQGVDRLTGH